MSQNQKPQVSLLHRIPQGLLSLYLALALAIPVPVVHAVLNSSTDPNAIDASKLSAATPDTAELCNTIISNVDWGQNDTANFSGRLKNLDGGEGWTETDDATCAKLGAPTEASVPVPSATPGQAAASDCNLNLPKSVIDEVGGCKSAGKKIFRCKMKNSQIEKQCMAYMASDAAMTASAVLLAINIVATLLCTTACVLTATGVGAAVAQGFTVACSVMSGVAMVTEIVQAATMSEGAVGSILAATAGGVGSITAGVSSGVGFVKDTGNTTQFATNTTGTQSSTGAVLVCVSAVFMAIMTIIRGVTYGNASGTKDKAKEEIDKLLSENTVVSDKPVTESNYSNFSPTNGVHGGGGSGGTSGSGSGGSAGGGSGSVPQADADNPLGKSSFATAGKDAAALKASGLDRASVPKANELLKNGLLDQVKKSGAAAALAANIPGDSSGIGQSIGALGKALEEDKGLLAKLAADAGVNASVGGMGGGAGGGSSGGGAANPFAGLLGAPAAKDAGPASGMKFGATPAAQKIDIYHTGSPLSIFEIVSGKIETVRTRVEGGKAPAPATQKPATVKKK